MKANKTIHSISLIARPFRDWTLNLIFLCLLIPISSFCQEYGLEFAGQPNSKDKRTSLDLNPEGYYTFRGEFELSFSMKLRESLPTTFGYVTRIVDQEGNNIDIIFNGPQAHSLQVVYDQSLTNISVADNDPEIYEQWTDIRLRYNLREKTLLFITPDTSILQQDIDFSGKVKIFFGRNDFDPVQTTDVPRMNLKDIRIYQKGKCLHHFPLDEMSGNQAKDIISNKIAVVQNPGWTKPGFYHWTFSFPTILNGSATMCYEAGEEKLYMVGDEMLKIFSVLKDSIDNIEYSATFSELDRGSQVIYDTISESLICYNLMYKTVHSFDFTERKWEEIHDGPNVNVRYWTHNKYFSSPDSVLYAFGGYGQHTYFNLVQQYDFRNDQWKIIKPRGEVFHPRMHAAIGYYADSVYIIGGYGSRAGDQILKPEHYTDLMAFSLTEKEFVKKYEFQAPMDDIDFAHSMVINEDDLSYYVLATNIFEYETYLQLLKGNLKNPELIQLGDKIDYLFHNENSYSDLFYSRGSQELIAATSIIYPDINETRIEVHKISFPPHVTELESDEARNQLGRILVGVLILMVVVTSAVMVVKNVKRKKKQHSIDEAGIENNKTETDALPEENSVFLEKPKKAANSILFFGGFQVINNNGDDITKKFTPLLKELFLLIFLYSIKDKGISVPRLTELLWFSMDAKTAKNNRAVNIAKLKNLLSEIASCTISRKTSYWQLEFNDSVVYNDYWTCIKNMNHEKNGSQEDLLEFLCIINKGPLLGNASYEWLDEFKLECSNLIIDHLTHQLKQENIGSDPELMIQLADAILIFDMMHEEAIGIKCKALTALGKHSLAKDIFAKFSKDYFTLYDEPFKRSFTDIIKN